MYKVYFTLLFKKQKSDRKANNRLTNQLLFTLCIIGHLNSEDILYFTVFARISCSIRLGHFFVKTRNNIELIVKHSDSVWNCVLHKSVALDSTLGRSGQINDNRPSSYATNSPAQHSHFRNVQTPQMKYKTENKLCLKRYSSLY